MGKRRRRKRVAILVPVASMGDIAFLLIIFFMVCSQFAKDPSVPIAPPTTVDVDELDDYPMVVLIDVEGRLYFQGEVIASPKEIESEVRQLVENTDNVKMQTVLLRCDRDVERHVFEPVIEAIAKGGGRIAAVGKESDDSP